MKEAQTLSEVLQKLAAQGYTYSFKAEAAGLKVCEKDLMLSPDDLLVEQIFRFEGETDLDEEAMLFALHAPKIQLKGTYLVAFGAKMASADAAMVRHLKKA